MKKIFKPLVLVLIALSLAACHKKSVQDMASLTEFDQTLQVHKVWSTSIGSGAHKEYLKLTPALVGSNLYVVDYSGRVAAINANTGRKLWSTKTKQALTSGVGADANSLYVGTKGGEVLALNASNGQLIWRAPVSNEVFAAPNADSSSVLVKTLDDHLYALNKQNGQQRWTRNEPTPNMSLRGGNPPQVSDGLVVVGFANGQLGVFNISNGEQVWKQAIAEPQGFSVMDQMVDINGSLAVKDSTVYVATYQGVLTAIGLRSGQTLWQKDLSSYAGLAVDSQNVYVTDAKSHVVAFNRHSGAVAWRQDKLYGRGLTGPAIVGNVLVIADSKGYVHWLSTQDGRLLARTKSGDKKGVLTTPIVSGRDVYIYSSSGDLVKYRI